MKSHELIKLFRIFAGEIKPPTKIQIYAKSIPKVYQTINTKIEIDV